MSIMSTWDNAWLLLLLLLMAFVLAKLMVTWLVQRGYLMPRYRNHGLVLFLALLLLLLILLKERQPKNLGASELLLPSVEEAVIEAEGRILALREDCGQLCPSSLTMSTSAEGLITKEVDCAALSEEHGHELVSSTFWSEVPKHISPEMLALFSYDKEADLTFDYKAFDLSPAQDWSKAEIEEYSTTLDFDDDKLKVFNALKNHLNPKDKKALVLTMDDKPVIEGMLLSLGISNIVTVDHRGITSHHERVHVIHPAALPRLYHRKGSEGEQGFDLVVAVMSLQSLGMGRYGDGLHPWKDLVTVARAWCLTRSEGHMFVVVPSHRQRDSVVFNSHRVYGPKLRSHLFANWDLVWSAEDTMDDFDKVSHEVTMAVLKKRA